MITYYQKKVKGKTRLSAYFGDDSNETEISGIDLAVLLNMRQRLNFPAFLIKSQDFEKIIYFPLKFCKKYVII